MDDMYDFNTLRLVMLHRGVVGQSPWLNGLTLCQSQPPPPLPCGVACGAGYVTKLPLTWS